MSKKVLEQCYTTYKLFWKLNTQKISKKSSVENFRMQYSFYTQSVGKKTVI